LNNEKLKENSGAHSVNVRFKKEDYDFLLEWSKEEMLTVSAIVRTTVMNVIKQKKGKSKPHNK
jgi:hypothetical protein